MLRKLIALAVVFGVALAGPAAKLSSSAPEDVDLTGFRAPISEDIGEVRSSSNHQLERLIPESTYLLLDLFNGLAGYKFTALSLGVLAIEWLVSNAFVIILGAAAAVGLCKVTGKCNLDYEAYIPVAQLKNLVTPEYLETAEKFLVSAVEKYAEKKARSVQSSRPWFY